MFLFAMAYTITWIKNQESKYIDQNYNHSVSIPLQEYGQILSYNLSAPKNICTFYQSQSYILPKTNIFIQDAESEISSDVDKLSVEQMYKGSQSEINQFTQNQDRLILLINNRELVEIDSSHNTLVIGNVTGESFSQILYDDLNGSILYLTTKQAIFFDKENKRNVLYGWNIENCQFKAKIDGNKLYVVQGKYGIQIYSVEKSNLLQIKIIDSFDLYGVNQEIDLVDIIVEGNSIYVLDRLRGITQLLNYIRNAQLGLITLEDGVLFNKKNDTMMVLIQLQTYSIAIELVIDQEDYSEIRRFQYNGRFNDLIQSNQFSIMNGHGKLIFMANHLYNKLLQLSYDYTVQTKALHIGMFNGQAFAIFRNSITFYQLRQQSAYLHCNAQENTNIILNLNSTDCNGKNQKGKSLHYCQSQLKYSIEVNSPLMSMSNQDNFTIICVILVFFIFMLILIIVYIYRKYQIDKELVKKYAQIKNEKMSKNKNDNENKIVLEMEKIKE